MEPFGIGMTGLVAVCLATLGAFALALRQRRRRAAGSRDPADRLEDLAAAQAELEARLEALAAEARAPEERLQAMAGQLLGLIRDKNATLETALAGLDQLRARMRALEEMGEPAEARAMLEGLRGRIDALQAAQAAEIAALEARLKGPGEGVAELVERLARLQEARDAGLEAALARLGPLEARLAGFEGGVEGGREALKRLEARIEALQGEERAARAELAALKAEAAPARALGEELARAGSRRDAEAEAMRERVAALEAGLAARDPQPALAGIEARLAAVQGRLATLEGAEAPFSEISDQLTRLYAQKDATVETVFARLAPLEARLAEVEEGVREQDPRALLDRFAERLEAVQGRLATLEGAEAPFAEISDQLTRLYAQKDATVETVFARLAPLEARLAEVEEGVREQDPRALLDRFAERLEAVQGRLATLEGAEAPFAEISDQLTRLYAQKDATVETVFARLAPLEARLAELDAGLARLAPLAEDDPRAAVEGLRLRLEGLHWAQGEMAAGLAALQAAGAEGGALAEVADRLARLVAEKDAGVAALVEWLAPLEARLAELEARPWDPEAETARAEAQAIAAQLIAARAAADETARFADRLAELEASLPRLSAAEAEAMRARELSGAEAMRVREPSGAAPPAPAKPAAPVPSAEDLEAIWSLPRIVSLHHR